MKTINPVQIWHNGQVKTVTLLDARIVDDNLSSSCSFYWQLKEELEPISGSISIASGRALAEGHCYMNEDTYSAWDGSNDAAYTFIAEQINVTIVE